MKLTMFNVTVIKPAEFLLGVAIYSNLQGLLKKIKS